MGHMIELTCSDGVKIGAYRADPVGKPRGGMVVLQEIFGVNAHIRSVADRYAALGYLAIAPATFDRVQKNVQIAYGPEDFKKGFELIGKVDFSKTPLDVAAAIEVARASGKVGVVGFCWGGTLAFASACHQPHVAACVGYYGGNIIQMIGDQPKVPLMLHFGEKDEHIPMDDVAKIKAVHPSVPVYVYPAAGHAFNRDGNEAYEPASAALAQERTTKFFAEHLG